MQAAWAAADAVPAAQQRSAESGALAGGERALHWLETLPPAAAWDALLPLALNAAAALLHRSHGAALAPAAAALERCHAGLESLMPSTVNCLISLLQLIM